MARFAVVDSETNTVENVVVWNGARWMAPKGKLVIQADTVSIGDVYDANTNTFTKQPETPIKDGDTDV